MLNIHSLHQTRISKKCTMHLDLEATQYKMLNFRNTHIVIDKTVQIHGTT